MNSFETGFQERINWHDQRNKLPITAECMRVHSDVQATELQSHMPSLHDVYCSMGSRRSGIMSSIEIGFQERVDWHNQRNMLPATAEYMHVHSEVQAPELQTHMPSIHNV